MVTLPKHIMNYQVSSKSPTEELIILGRLLSEVGDFASTTLDSKYQRLANSCRIRLNKVIEQLVKRDIIEKKEDLYDLSPEEKSLISNPEHQESTASKLQTLTISELEVLCRFRQGYDRPVEKSGSYIMSSLHCKYEIIRELEKRKPVDLSEQLKKDYCTLTFQNELDYSSFLLGAPIGAPSEYIPMDRNRIYSPDKLLALIREYSGYWSFKSVFHKIMLEQYVDYAITIVDNCPDVLSVAPLIAGIAHENSSLGHSYTPWVNNKLKEVIRQWEKNPSLTDLYMVPVLYAMHYNTRSWKYEREARKILTAAYKSALVPQESIDLDIDYICTVAENLNMSFPYNVRKLMTRLITVCQQVIDFDIRLSSAQITRLLDAADNMRYVKELPSEIEDTLRSRLSVLAETDDFIAQIFS